VIIEQHDQAITWWNELMQRGVYVNLVMPPASPSSYSLLRCSMSAAHTPEQIDRIIDSFAALTARANTGAAADRQYG
jgi:8-amino-7-oxononanoate synthase